jgi:ParB/RepB/Spo0J family partition protein
MKTLSRRFQHIPTAKIRPNSLNPRREFDPESIKELADSFQIHGIIQPLIVYAKRDTFVLICGERRFRAAQSAKLKEVPAIVHLRPPTDDNTLAMALIENLQRREVDPVSESCAIRSLIDDHEWGVSRVADELGAGVKFVRQRYLLTRFTNVLAAYTAGTLSLSEAVEIATIVNESDRQSVLDRMQNGEISDLKALISAVKRIKQIRDLVEKGGLNKRPLLSARIAFHVDGLPGCDQHCPHYIRLTWDEKQRHGIDSEKSGWGEYCVEPSGCCYKKKEMARDEKLRLLEEFQGKRDIYREGSLSMLWMKVDGLMCRTCPHMLDPGILRSDHASPVCTNPNSKCFEKRRKAFAKLANHDKRVGVEAAERARLDLQLAVNDQRVAQERKIVSRLTKPEIAFILVQMLFHCGGTNRLVELLKNLNWLKNSPRKTEDRMTFLRNKLIDDLPEAELHDLILSEAANSALHSGESVRPTCFDRTAQKVKIIPIKRK